MWECEEFVGQGFAVDVLPEGFDCGVEVEAGGGDGDAVVLHAVGVNGGGPEVVGG